MEALGAHTLNEQQRAAAEHGDGPLLVIAGAGTGKTMVLAHRVAALVSAGADPARILLLTFTRKAAEEMLRRVDGLLRQGEVQGAWAVAGAEVESQAVGGATTRVWGGTFHSVAARLLRREGRSIGLAPGFSILDRGDAEDLMGIARSEVGPPTRNKRFPLKGTCLDIYSRCVNSGDPLARIVHTHFPWCGDFEGELRQVFLRYTQLKEAQAVLDYDDLLLCFRSLLRGPRGPAIAERFTHVLVDEYQDTNHLQAAVLPLLCPSGKGLTVVGDDCQAIYSFRSATVRNILDFPHEFAGATVVRLEQNFRSTQPLLAATNGVIAASREWFPKHLWSERRGGDLPMLVTCEDENEQTDVVVERILAHREEGALLRRQAVLFRAAHHSLALELELGRRGIPFRKFGGLRFIETAHVKDLLAFLRLAENPRDLAAGHRVLGLVPGIGRSRSGDLLKTLAHNSGRFEAWAEYPAPAKAAETWSALLALFAQLQSERAVTLPAQISLIRMVYEPLLELAHDHPAPRIADLRQLELVSGNYQDRATFLAEVTLDPPSWSGDLAGAPHLDDDYLVLSTIHSAKGLEWHTVYVIHAADGNIPSDLATGSPEGIEEERRLLYVALTRARNRLYVCVPLRYQRSPRNHLDTYGLAQPSRFLQGPAASAFDRTTAGCLLGKTAGDPEQTEPDDRLGDQPTIDVRKELRAMWS
jgi:DNA helicase-2/ATP-dependent DNA helicase PcrA